MGNCYKIRIVQLLQAEKKIRERNVVKRMKCPDLEQIVEMETNEESQEEPLNNMDEVRHFLQVLDTDFTEKHLADDNAINYVAGACANIVKTKVFADNDCASCHVVFTTGEVNGNDGSPYMLELQNGGLLMANVFNICLTRYCSQLAAELYSNKLYSTRFLGSKNQKNLLKGLMWQIVGDYVDDVECPACQKPYKLLMSHFLSSLCSTVLVGLSKLIWSANDLEQEKIRIERQNKQRQTLTRKRLRLENESQAIDQDISYI